jgi:4-hydroxy-3-polyprenylbenzoate decarboxylase
MIEQELMNNGPICHDLREFLDRLAVLDELQTIKAPVSPRLEIAAITDRVCKSVSENRALLFTTVIGSRFRVATNLYGSEKRMGAALGIDGLSGLTGRFDELLAGLPGGSATETLAALPGSALWRTAVPVIADDYPPDLAVTEEGLDALPILQCHPGDGKPEHDGRFLTLPLVITAQPDGDGCNVGIYRAAVVDSQTLAISWGEGSGAAAHAGAWRETGEPMPVTIALGGPPALLFTASLPLPADLDEFTFGGMLLGKPLCLCRCENGLIAPAGAETVIEGYLLPENLPSGAFGNHTGGYTPSGSAAAVRITAIRRRSDLILPATVVGKPPMEDCWLARAGGFLLLSLLKLDVPEVSGLHLPFAGIFHGAVFVAVTGATGRGKEILAVIGQTPWFRKSRLLVLVDAEQDPADESGVCWRVMNHVDWGRDLVVEGDRLSIDATRKPAGREPVIPDPTVLELVNRRWREYGFTAE